MDTGRVGHEECCARYGEDPLPAARVVLPELWRYLEGSRFPDRLELRIEHSHHDVMTPASLGLVKPELEHETLHELDWEVLDAEYIDAPASQIDEPVLGVHFGVPGENAEGDSHAALLAWNRRLSSLGGRSVHRIHEGSALRH